MTRINLVKVDNLADQHLFAEWREIKMVPAALRRSLRTQTVQQVLKKIPDLYTLNAGHVTFFYDKMLFLHARYLQLTQELEYRNFGIAAHNEDQIFLADIPTEFKTRLWSPIIMEKERSIERIVTRLGERPDWYKYYGKTRPPKLFADLYRLEVSGYID